jgi:integrase
MQKDGYAPSTILSHSEILRHLAKVSNLSNPEAIKEYLASHNCSIGMKEKVVNVYANYAKFNGLTFSKPRYQRVDTLPFIPLEKEAEALIDACRNIRHATMLRLLYETGMRVGEATRLQFKDCDFERRTVRVLPEKGSRARELRISEKLVAMLKQVYSQYPTNPLPNPGASKKHLGRTRKYLARAHNNPRFLQIHLHTLRHLRATIVYHQTKDLLYTQQILGHRSISNTIKYAHLVDWGDSDQLICKAAKTLEEASKLIESGFDYVTELDGVKLFRKRK